jgi:hypothetical protein
MIKLFALFCENLHSKSDLCDRLSRHRKTEEECSHKNWRPTWDCLMILRYKDNKEFECIKGIKVPIFRGSPRDTALDLYPGVNGMICVWPNYQLS